MKRAATLWAVASCLLVTSSASSAQTCVGDCNGDNTVAINELIIGVNIAQGSAPISECPSFDVNGDSSVGINELITAVNNALDGCDTPTGTMRSYSIAPGVLLEEPGGTTTGLFTTGLSGANASDGFTPGPLQLLLGPQDTDGVGSLRLTEDVYVRIGVIDGSYLCFHMQADGSDGSIDCDGGTAYDTRSTQPAGDVGFSFAFETDLGEPSGPGDGNLLVPVLFQLVGLDSPDYGKPCEEVTYSNPLQTFPFTTTTATSIKGTNLELSVEGEPFDCANFGTPGSGGQLAAGAPATQAPIGDVANVFRLGELPPQ